MKNKLFFATALICFSILLITSSYSAEPNTASISGYIKDNGTLRSISGVKVKLNSSPGNFETTTNSSGYYEFASIPVFLQKEGIPNKAQLVVSQRDYKSEMLKIDLMPGQSYNFDFSLESRFKYPVIKGTVVNTQTSLGIPNAVVSVSINV